ncbi:MAG: 23S rRNA (guanosine(2251)-2'-O)-methyltransferase RlmB [Anaerolineae bacterium]
MSDVIYGRHPVLEALQSGRVLDELLLAEGVRVDGALAEIVKLARERQLPLKYLPRPALDRLVGRAEGGVANHQGVAARSAGFVYSDLASILARAIRAGEPPLILVLDAIQDVHNLGSLIRSAEAVGAHGALIAERGGAGVTAAVQKASAGAVAHLPVARTDLVTALDQLRQRGVRVVGLDGDAPITLGEAELGGPLALVVGSEGKGLSKAVARRCDALVRLPMRGRVGSLNAAVAGSVALYEALRQRELAETGGNSGAEVGSPGPEPAG